MSGQAGYAWCAHLRAWGLFTLLAAAPAPALDLSGVYVSEVTFLGPVPCTLTFEQTGTTLTVTGPCDFVGTIYTFDLAGTVDTTTGAFTLSGQLFGLCEGPGAVTMTGSGDGEVFIGTSSCGSVSTPVSGTKCGNGLIDPSEECEDGNALAGDCCSPICRFDPVDAACAADATSCTRDVCDGAGHCLHAPAASGTSCETDLNGCTDDVCDAAGECTHVDNTGPCDDFNLCTTADLCAAGECAGGPIAAECVGPVDLTGDWELSPGAAFLISNPVRLFAQSGAVLRSTGGTAVGTGSVNPASGAFVALTPFDVLSGQCMEVLSATAALDSQSFSGVRSFNCGLDGTFGPYQVSGRRCAGGTCACASSASCTTADSRTRLVIRSDNGGSPVRWQWVASSPTVLGDPTANADYQICVEKADGSVIATATHGSDWRPIRAGFRYRPSAGPIQRLLVKSTSKRTVVAASLLPDAALALPSSSPIRVRLLRTTDPPLCLEAQFANPTVNTTTRYLAVE